MPRLTLVLLLLVTATAGFAQTEDLAKERRTPPPKQPPKVRETPELERSLPRDPDATKSRTSPDSRVGLSHQDTDDDALPSMPRSSWIPGQDMAFEEHLIFDCETVRICELEPLDAYAAWMIAAQTTFPWKVIVDARTRANSWAQALEALDIRPWEVLWAFDLSTDARHFPTDTGMRELAKRHLGEIRPPAWNCRFPVELEGVSAEEIERRAGRIPRALDWIDTGIAERIAEETGWCVDDLLEARRFLGSWPRVARQLYISPFLFEASFGIRLNIQALGLTLRARYPLEQEMRRVVEGELWPEVGRN